MCIIFGHNVIIVRDSNQKLMFSIKKMLKIDLPPQKADTNLYNVSTNKKIINWSAESFPQINEIPLILSSAVPSYIFIY